MISEKIKLASSIALFIASAGYGFAAPLYLTCQVEGREVLYLGKGYGVDDRKIGPASITVKVEDTAQYLSIDISGTRPFNNTGVFFEKNKPPTRNEYGLVTNDLFKAAGTFQQIETMIEINRVTAQITVTEKSDMDGTQGRMNFSGFCTKMQNQKF